jgi:hypothetical protein
MSENVRTPQEHSLFTLKLVWFGVIFFLGLFFLYLSRLRLAAVGDAAGGQPSILLILTFQFVGVAMFVFALLLPKIVRRQLVHGGTFINFRNMEPSMQLAVSYILSYSLFEGVALYGILLAFLVMNPSIAFPFFVAALVGLFVHRPRQDLFKNFNIP